MHILLKIPFTLSAAFFIVCLLLLNPKLTYALIAPGEVAVLVNEKSADSVRIGELYITLRGVPKANLVKIRVEDHENITRNKFNELIALPLKNALKELHLKGVNIRCIVTTYGVPLRVGSQRPPEYSAEEMSKYGKLREKKEEELTRLKEEAKEKKELRKEIKALKDEINGLRMKINHLTGQDTIAAVDSEIALLLSPEYDLSGWKPNPEFLYNKARSGNKPERILIVGRIDAPTPELAGNMVRTAIEVEKSGLSGRVYLDARGKTGDDPYSRFDADIRRTAEILQKSALPVVLDNDNKLFGPGEAPMAALYCGWYSLGNYVDAFEWVKGAVGYHVASSEAVSLRNPKRRYWVKSMIEDGVAATLGPVAEPYLASFPPPSLFFPLLMSGRYTLGEVYVMTNPFVSWQMILVGDPLYNPFKNNPPLILENAPLPPL